MRTSRLAKAAAGLALVGSVLVALGPALIAAGALAPMAGFQVFGLGGLFSLFALLASLLALFHTRPATGLSGRGVALAGALLAAAGFLALAVPALQARSYPPINDITTSPGDPPGFVAAAGLEPNRGRDLAYPGSEFATQQRAAYPDLAPLELDVPPPAAFETVLRVLEDEGLTITHRDPAAGHIEAYEVTSIFRFVDDVAVRIQPSAAGSRIDLRSKSRDGRGDLGANALRIERLQAAIRAQP